MGEASPSVRLMELEALFTAAGFGGFRVIDVDARSSALLAIRGDGSG